MGWLRAGSLGLAVLVCTAGCESKSDKQKDAEADEGSSKGKKSGKKKRVKETASEGFLGILGEDGFNVFADLDEPEAVDGSGVLSFGGAEHSSLEPEKFSAGWAGREAGIVLKRAIDKEFESRLVKGGKGPACQVFMEGDMVRRLLINYEESSYEYAMNDAGHIILWLGAWRTTALERQLAFFHRGTDLKLYQAWEDRGQRRTEPAPEGTREAIFSEVNRCYDAAKAANPRPTTAPSSPAPIPVDRPGEGAPVEAVAYEVIAKHSGLCLEVKDGSKENGQTLVQAACTRAESQRFKLWVHENGVMMTALHSGNCLDIAASGKDNGVALTQSSCSLKPNQVFLLTPMATGEFRLAAKHSGRCFDVLQGSKDAGAAVVQWDCTEQDNQRWSFRKAE